MVQQKQTRGIRRRRKYWQEQVRRQLESGLAVAAYSRKFGVKVEQLYKWRGRIKIKPGGSKGFVELRPIAPVPRIGESYEVHLRPTPHIRINGSFTLGTLKELLVVLREL